MKLKLSILAASLALAFSGNASAGIAQAGSGNGELFLAAWFAGADATPGTADDRTYVRDLGNGVGGDSDAFGTGNWDINDIVGTTSTPALNAQFTTSGTIPFAADARWGDFTNGLSSQQVGTIQWAVLAGDSTGSGAGNRRFVMTVNGDAAATLNSSLPTWGLNMDVFLSNSPGQGAPLTPDVSSVFVGTGPGNGNEAFGANLGAGSPPIAGAMGSQLGFWLYNNSSSTGTGIARNVQFLNAAAPTFAAYWQLNPTGELIYAVPVPEPGTWAMLAAGLLAVGAIARRRATAV